MLLKYDPSAAVLKLSFQLEDVPVEQQYSNLVSSIKALLSDSTIPETDKQSIISLLRKKTGEPIDTVEDLIFILDSLHDQGVQLKQAYELVEQQDDKELGTYSTQDDTAGTMESTEPLAEPIEPDSDEL